MVLSSERIANLLLDTNAYPTVQLNNPEVVRDTLITGGKFASICKANPNECGELENKVYAGIGKHCISSGHFSPFRGINWHFTIINMSTVASHQLVRHHAGVAINQLSGVFTKTSFESNPLVLTKTLRTALSKECNKSILDDIALGLAKIENGLTNLEKAEPHLTNSDLRYLMPRACGTAMNIAVSPEALIHICHERLCTKAQPEIRHIVRQMANEIIKIDPFWKDLLVPKCEYLHGCNEKLGCGYYVQKEATKYGSVSVEPLSVRIRGEVCKNCGTVLLYKNDDPSPFSNRGLCRKCEREMERKEMERIAKEGE